MNKTLKTIKQNRIQRAKKVRMSIVGTAQRPRMSVFRSNTGIYVQLIDDVAGKTLVSANAKEIKISKGGVKNKTEVSAKLGKLIAKKALIKKINMVVFDRNKNKYHGRVKAVAESAREAGLKI